jgi:autotransporter translocation and assembly factor TamB
LSATASRAGAANVALDAPRLDLADLNDFFDAGDTFAGTGSLALRAGVDGSSVRSTSGNANFVNARYRRIDLGTVAARWNGTGTSVATALSFGGPTGEVSLNGTIAPASRSMNVAVTARRVDLATWLPMLGFNVPVTGRLDAETTLIGSYPDLAMRAHAAVFNGTAGRMPLDRFEVAASMSNGRGRIDSAVLDVRSMTTSASGTFGLHPGDPLAITVTSTSANVGDFLTRATGKEFGVSGALSSALHVEGTRAAPRLRDNLTLANVRYRNVTVPRVAGEIDVDRHSVAVRNGAIDLERGRALFSAAMPIALSGSHLTPANGPITGSVTANDLELSNFAALLPKGTQISGRIDGRVSASGTIAAPNLDGLLTLADGTFDGPIERSPITGIAGNLSFAGTQARLDSHALVGAGTVTASAVASVRDLRRPADATFTLSGSATNARVDLPAYFQGDLNGTIAMSRAPGSLPAVRGNLEISKARLPVAAFLALNKGGGSKPQLPNVAFNGVQFSAGPDVRVQSANVDIGTTGAVRLGGTLNAPTLAGGFHSTGGSLSFYRTFYVQSGDVHFDPSSGLIPDVNAVATTFVPDPATAVRLHVSGPVTDMNLAFASDPSYSREQILGLLVGAQQFGAVRGVASTGGSPFSASGAARSLAYGQLNTVFTRNMLEPLSTQLGSALGFTEVQITSDLQTGVGVNAVKALGKYVNAIYRQTFGFPQEQSVALEARPNDANAYRFTAYSAQGPTLFGAQQPQPAAASVLNVNPATSYTPIGASNGVSLLYLRRWW